MNFILKVLCFLLLFGCASESENKKLKDRSVDEIYDKARLLLKEEEYKEAAAEFKNIESLFPYSSKASEGQILAAYCYFLASEYGDALREIEVFLRYHPSHVLVPYALYLRAMCKYVQIAPIGKDSGIALDAKGAFVELMNKFPRSEYGKDSLKKIKLLDDVIAAHEMLIGRYYQKNGNPLSAMNRYVFAASRFHHTNYAEEALYRTIECCLSLGLNEEAENALRTLEAEFPLSRWAIKAKLLIKK
jgi:outer membrane protein assembly factor BamD